MGRRVEPSDRLAFSRSAPVETDARYAEGRTYPPLKELPPMRSTVLKSLAVVVGVAATASVAGAQLSAQGLSVNARLGYATGYTVKGEDFDTDELKTDGGILGGIGLGYAFTPMFGLYANMDLAKQESSTEGLDGDFGVAYFEFGTRINLTMLQSAKFLP